MIHSDAFALALASEALDIVAEHYARPTIVRDHYVAAVAAGSLRTAARVAESNDLAVQLAMLSHDAGCAAITLGMDTERDGWTRAFGQGYDDGQRLARMTPAEQAPYVLGGAR